VGLDCRLKRGETYVVVSDVVLELVVLKCSVSNHLESTNWTGSGLN
jgi:hypothetical protein